MKPSHFNLRVYGLLVNTRNEILLSEETYKGRAFTKFPGGGVQLGEGIEEALHRELKEEANLKIRIKRLVHVSGQYIASAFDDSQVIGVYYLIEALHEPDLTFKELISEAGKTQNYHWVPLQDMPPEHLSFPMDQAAWQSFKSQDTADK